MTQRDPFVPVADRTCYDYGCNDPASCATCLWCERHCGCYPTSKARPCAKKVEKVAPKSRRGSAAGLDFGASVTKGESHDKS